MNRPAIQIYQPIWAVNKTGNSFANNNHVTNTAVLKIDISNIVTLLNTRAPIPSLKIVL